MIITRTPLRISLGGGGTDLPSYYQRFGGALISAAINRYVYIGLSRIFERHYFIRYSQNEAAPTLAEIRHPIVREAFARHGIEPGVEMISMADIPGGTGLGSSGAFNVGLHKAIHAYKGEEISTLKLAEEACQLELEVLREPIGKQDQYIAACGGIRSLEIDRQGRVSVCTLKLPQQTLADLQERLLLFFTGYSRSASRLLSDQKARTEKDDPRMLENLHSIKELGLKSLACLQQGDTRRFGELLHEHWLHKQQRSPGMSNDDIDRFYELGRAHGALGGKLIGAGGGGFLLFYASDPESLRAAMRGAGLFEQRFSFDFDGATVLVKD